jgi:hypothetical protein
VLRRRWLERPRRPARRHRRGPPPGYYAVEATADGQTLSCRVLIDPDGGGLADEPDPIVVDGKHLRLTACWLDPREGNVALGYEEGGGPDEVTVTVRRGQVVLAQQTDAPTYEPFDPNGPGCTPHLFVAHDHMTVPARVGEGPGPARFPERD